MVVTSLAQDIHHPDNIKSKLFIMKKSTVGMRKSGSANHIAQMQAKHQKRKYRLLDKIVKVSKLLNTADVGHRKQIYIEG